VGRNSRITTASFFERWTQNRIKMIQGKPTGLFKLRVSYTEKIKWISELARFRDRSMDHIIVHAQRWCK
jgi:hypothetical protein